MKWRIRKRRKREREAYIQHRKVIILILGPITHQGKTID